MFKKLVVKSIYILTILFGLLLTLELYARFVAKQPYYAFPENYFISNEFYGYELTKNFKGKYSQPEFTISIDTNSDGLRDIEYSKDETLIKILALGDSFSFGIGVEMEETFLSLLEQKLNRNKENKKYAVIKAGIVGYSTYNEKIYLEKKGLYYNPNVVIVQFWWDDLGVDRITYLSDTGFLTTGKITNFAQLRMFLNRHFRSYAFLRRIFMRKLKRAPFGWSPVHSTLNDELMNKFRITLNQFKDAESICKRNNIPILFVLIPPKEFTNSNSLEYQWQDFCSVLEENKMSYVDTLPILKESVRARENPFFKIDPHLNTHGHRIVALKIYEYLSSINIDL